MPRSVNYNLGKIYKIYYLDDPSMCYVDNTAQPYLCNRMQQHIFSYNKVTDFTKCIELYKFVHSKGGWSNFKIVLLEKYPCNSIAELSERTAHHMQEENATLNKKAP